MLATFWSIFAAKQGAFLPAPCPLAESGRRLLCELALREASMLGCANVPSIGPEPSWPYAIRHGGHKARCPSLSQRDDRLSVVKD